MKWPEAYENCLRPRDLSDYKLTFSSFHSKVEINQAGVGNQEIDPYEIGVERYNQLKAELETIYASGNSRYFPYRKAQKKEVGNVLFSPARFPSKI